MVAPSGARLELRQTDANTDLYESADSSYLQLQVVAGTNGQQLILRSTDGTQVKYEWNTGAYRCAQIKDRNGNFISVNHNQLGLLQSVTDTLGRAINVSYDGIYPTSITQTRRTNNGDQNGANYTHAYATFTYTTVNINTNFAGLAVNGPSNGTTLKVLQKITSASGSSTTFEYNGYGQVSKVSNYAANGEFLNSTGTNLATPAASETDCPRFTETYNSIKSYNINHQPITISTVTKNRLTTGTFAAGSETLGPVDMVEVWMDNAPINRDVHSKTYYHTAVNWAEGLPFATEDVVGGVRKRWTRTVWDQDDTTKAYKINPRVIESKVGDQVNTKRTKIYYYNEAGNNYGLVKDIEIYGTDQTTVEKRIHTDYNLNAAYTSKRIIGLPAETEVYGYDQETLLTPLVSKTVYGYDDENNFSETEQNIASVIQHDNANYGASFIFGRGNLTATTQCDAEASNETSCAGGVTAKVRHNTAGAIVKQMTPDVNGNLTREVKISYADKFNDDPNNTLNRNTYAYPTTVTTAGATPGTANEVSSSVNYRYDIGANVWAKSPAPAGSSTGKETTRVFDNFGRLERETFVNNGAYTRYQYLPNGVQAKTFTTVKTGAGEVESESWTDGAGRTLRSRTKLPNSAGGWTGSLIEYDTLGQVKRSTVPTEINASWQPAGDDYRGDAQGSPIWLWKSFEYDWKGRIKREINTDGTDKLFDYQGCGCAGGQVTTIQGEEIFETDWAGDYPQSIGRRTQKIYQDIHGRNVQTEIYDFQGNVSTSSYIKFNGRDQAVSIKRYGDAQSPETEQETTMSYDGFGRLKTQHRPEQIKPDGTPGYTNYNYNADGSIESVVDARGASTKYVYEHRGLVKQVYYTAPAGIRIPATVDFTYDALGNRTAMTEVASTGGLGGTTYSYDWASRLQTETRSFNDAATGFNQSFTFNYGYNLVGQLTTFTDPNDTQRSVTYARDEIGRVTSVDGGGFNGVTSYASNLQYRAFGAIKNLTYGSGKQLTQTFNNRLQLEQFFVNGGSNSFDTLGSTNKYYADGRIKSAADLFDNRYDRLYKYDHMGRIVEARSGQEARDPSQTTIDRPYNQTYTYNAFGNLTNRTSKVWHQTPEPMTASYTNNRRIDPNWVYDADGRERLNDSFWTFYDAAGRRFGTEGDITIKQTFDGDGRRIKQKEDNLAGGNIRTLYYVNSSLLGTIYELRKANGNWVKGSGTVYLNGQALAVHIGGTASWFYENPVRGATKGLKT